MITQASVIVFNTELGLLPKFDHMKFVESTS